jgi:hypothetical protein
VLGKPLPGPVGGERVYYRENLSKPEHTLESDLIPGKEYIWYIRERHGDNVGRWSSYNFGGFYIVYSYREWNYPFTLKIVSKRRS